MAGQLRIDIREDESGLYFESARLDKESGGHLVKHRPAREPDWDAAQAEVKAIFDRAFGGNQGWCDSLREWGGRAFTDYIPEGIQKELKDLGQGSVTWVLCSTRAAAFPWELAHDGEDFLLRKYACGRLLQGGQSKSRAGPNRSGSILLLSDLTGDLPEAYREGRELCAFLEQDTGLALQTETRYSRPQLLTEAGRDAVMEEMQKHEIVHFCGHSQFTGRGQDSGWRLSHDELLNLADMMDLGRYPEVPQLIFSNSCSSGEQPLQAEEALSGIAGAFLSAGVSGYIGAICRVEDSHAHDFARRFYQTLGNGRGHAANLHKVQRETPLEDPAWAVYRYYGDPVKKSIEVPHPHLSFPAKAGNLQSLTCTGANSCRDSQGLQKTDSRKKTAAVLLVLLVIAVLLGFLFYKKMSTGKLKQNFIYIEGNSASPVDSLKR
ncbi:CHAT domain-containing protein [Fibrobacterota bacterium]